MTGADTHGGSLRAGLADVKSAAVTSADVTSAGVITFIHPID
jgi:hypothetical protein